MSIKRRSLRVCSVFDGKDSRLSELVKSTVH